MTGSCRWLLLLGSNLEHDRVVREALRRLNTIAPAEALTDIRRFKAYGGRPGPYFNVLARWDMPAGRGEVVSSIKALERMLGRDPAAVRVDIDVDLLARADAEGRWRADPYAADKGEFTHAPVIALLREAGIEARDIL